MSNNQLQLTKTTLLDILELICGMYQTGFICEDTKKELIVLSQKGDFSNLYERVLALYGEYKDPFSREILNILI